MPLSGLYLVLSNFATFDCNTTTIMSDINLQEMHDFLVDVAKQAGEVITAARPSTTAAGEKKNSVDLVTETDQATERLITDLVRKSYPHFECALP